MDVRAWIENELWEDGYFQPDKLGERIELFRSGVSRPLVTSLVEGCRGTPRWSSYSNLSHTDSLFRRLRSPVRRYGASWFYVTDPDNVLSEFHWSEPIQPEYLNPMKLSESKGTRPWRAVCRTLELHFIQSKV